MKAICNKILCAALCLMFAGQGYSLNKNPASVGYVDQLIENLRQQTTYTAGAGTTITSNVISQSPNYAIGDVVHGGVVFWLDNTNRHGLVIAPARPHTAAAMCTTGPGPCDATISVATGIGVGLSNTLLIISMQLSNGTALNTLNYAPMQTLAYTDPSSNISGWYIPSRQELLEIYDQRTVVNNTLNRIGGVVIALDQSYWSSSANGTSTLMWAVDFSNGSQVPTDQSTAVGVLAVAQF